MRLPQPDVIASEAKQSRRLLRRYAPRNDGGAIFFPFILVVAMLSLLVLLIVQSVELFRYFVNS